MEEQQKKELKDLIEGELVNLFDDMASAKNDLDIVAKAAQDKFEIKAAVIKRMVKLHYEDSYLEKKEKEMDFYKTFEEVMS